MKYYSEVLDAFYDDPKELIKDETAALEKIAEEERAEEARREKLELEKKEREHKISNRKKELSALIEKADEELKESYKKLDKAKAKCDKLKKDTDKAISEILTPVKAEVKAAQTKHLEAISLFNKEFGPYRTVLTEADTEDVINVFDSMFNSFFDNFLKF